MRAVVLERNKLVGRRIARSFLAAGVDVSVVHDPAELPPLLDGASIIGADTFDGDVALDAVRSRPALRALLWTAEPLKRSLRYMVELPAISNVIGRKDFDSPPRAWELAMVIRRIVEPGLAAPGLGGFLDWGHAALELHTGTAAERDAAVAGVQAFVDRLQVPKRITEMLGELAHELLMNAMYDAPVDGDGRPRFADDRRADIALAGNDRPVLRIGSDGARVALQVGDRFGRLERDHVVGGLARGLAGGEMDTSRGGAGLGMMVVHNSSAAMFFDVVRGKSTEVTATFELDLNLREFRTSAKSLHVFVA